MQRRATSGPRQPQVPRRSLAQKALVNLLYPQRTELPNSLPSQRFHTLFDSLFKVLFIFPSRYLFTIGLVQVFSLRWSLPPTLGCNPNQPDSPKRPHVPQSVTPTHRAITFSGAPFLSDFGRTLQGRPFSRLQFANATHWRLQAWAVPASLTTTRVILVSFFSSAY